MGVGDFDGNENAPRGSPHSGQQPQPERGAGLRLRGHDRNAGVAAERNLRIDRDRSQKRNVQLLRGALASAVFEDLVAVSALRTDVIRHVLDDPEHRHVDLLEHRQALAGVDQRDVLRSGDDHGAREVDLLGQGELGVAGAGWKVHD